MNKTSALTLGFIEKRPQSAAKTLVSMAPEVAASFLDSIPTRYAVSVFSRNECLARISNCRGNGFDQQRGSYVRNGISKRRRDHTSYPRG